MPLTLTRGAADIRMRSKIDMRHACLLPIAAMLWGCEIHPVEETTTLDSMQEVLEEAMISNQQPDELPDAVAAALLPSFDLDADEITQLDEGQRFDISANQIPADQFFLSLVDDTSFNIVIHPDITGTITMYLKNVTIPDVLESVRDVYGFEFVTTSYGFQVLPGRLQARIFKINYLNIQRSGSSSTLVSSGALTTGAIEGQGGTGESSTGGSTTSVFGTQIRTEQPVTTFWSELRTSIETIVGAGGDRSVVVNPDSGVIVVRALPSEHREVEAYLRETQLIVQRQVILEAKIIEVQLDSRHQTGINWASFVDHDQYAVRAAQIGGAGILGEGGGASDTQGLQSSLNPADPSFLDNTLASAFGGVFSLAVDFDDFTAFIELLKTQGDVQILSSPRIATLNNQKAVIKIGTDEFFVTDISTTNVSSAATTTIIPEVTLTPFFSGIALDVTPQVSDDGYVILHVHPSISLVVDQQKTVTVGDVIQTLPLALSTIRETDSVVRARSGQVIVIGGLMQDRVISETASAGNLSKIPIIGGFFKQSLQTTVKSELVILLKPTVVVDDDEWQSALQQSMDAIDALRQRKR